MDRGNAGDGNFPFESHVATRRFIQLAKVLRKVGGELVAAELLHTIINGLHLEYSDGEHDEFSLVVDHDVTLALEVFDMFADGDVEPEAVWEFQEHGYMADHSVSCDPDIDRDDDGY